MDIEVGSEWFHRESLTVVKVLAYYPCEWGPTNFAVEIKTPCGETESAMKEFDFRRDYARNEPVTLELLERMGWECVESSNPVVVPKAGFEHGRFSFTWHPPFTGHPNGLLLLGARDDMEGGYAVNYLAPVATLRDLLNVLRVFGVEAGVPERA